MTRRYLSAEGRTTDDFGVDFTQQEGEMVYDAKTVHGPWATMTYESFRKHTTMQLGIGYGQSYRRAADGKLFLVEGSK